MMSYADSLTGRRGVCNWVLISGKRWAHKEPPLREESTRHCVVNGELRPAEGMDPSSAELLTTTATTGVGRKRQSQSGFGTTASSNRNEEEREQRDMREELVQTSGPGQNPQKVHSSTDSPPGSEAHVPHWQPQLPRESSLSGSSTPAPNTIWCMWRWQTTAASADPSVVGHVPTAPRSTERCHCRPAA